MSDRMYVKELEDVECLKGVSGLKLSYFAEAFLQYFEDEDNFTLWLHRLAEPHKESDHLPGIPESHYFGVEACQKMLNVLNGSLPTIDSSLISKEEAESYSEWLNCRDTARRMLELAVYHRKEILLQGDELGIHFGRAEREARKMRREARKTHQYMEETGADYELARKATRFIDRIGGEE